MNTKILLRALAPFLCTLSISAQFSFAQDIDYTTSTDDTLNGGFYGTVTSTESFTLDANYAFVGGEAVSEDSSIYNMVGGYATAATAYDNSVYNLYGGALGSATADGGSLNIYDSGVVISQASSEGGGSLSLFSGSIASGKVSTNSEFYVEGGTLASVTINGGEFVFNGGEGYDVNLRKGVLSVNDGQVGSIIAKSGTTVNYSGGFIGSIDAQGDSVFNIYAADFGELNAYSGMTVSSSDTTAMALISDAGNTLNLTFAGDATTKVIDFDFLDSWSGELNLVAVPEPSTIAAMIFGLGGLFFLSRRRKSALPTAVQKA